MNYFEQVSYTVHEQTTSGVALPRKGRNVALQVYWSFVAPSLSVKMRSADPGDVKQARNIRSAATVALLGPKHEYETDIEMVDEADGKKKWFRYWRFWNTLDGCEAFLSGTFFRGIAFVTFFSFRYFSNCEINPFH